MKSLCTIPILLLLVSCGQKPGTVQEIPGGKVYHLTQGALVQEIASDQSRYYLVDHELAKSYELGPKGLTIHFKRNSSAEKTGDTTTTTKLKYLIIHPSKPGRLAIQMKYEATARDIDPDKAAAILASLTPESTPESVLAAWGITLPKYPDNP